MRRRISICIIIFTAVLSAAVLINSQKKELPEETQMAETLPKVPDTEPVVVVNTDHTTAFLYVIRDNGGRAVVYRAETMEVYMETGIRTADLPEDIRNRMVSGIGFADEESLFDFLESYSS